MTRLLLIWLVQFTLLLSSWLNIIQRTTQNPVNQSSSTSLDSIIIHNNPDNNNNNNGTIIIAASPDDQDQDQQQNTDPLQQFNIRRRDMFFEDYSVKQIQVVDTVAITNNSITNNDNNSNGNNNSNSKIKSTFSPKKNNPSTQQPSQKPSTPVLNESPSLIINNNGINSDPIKPSPSTVIQEDPFKNQTFQMIGGDHNIKDLLILKPQRGNILLPKLEQTGKPSCLQTPDDTYCENVENYPKSIIKEEVYFSADQFSEIFGNKEIDGRTIMDVENDESVCGKTPRVIFPKMAKNQANQWIYVVNEVEYTQAVVAEVCERPGKPCAYMENLPLGMISSCKQKYSYKRLLALHPTEKRTYPDAFRFPSCCACYIKLMDDFLARSNTFRKIDKPINVADNSDTKIINDNDNNGDVSAAIEIQESESEQSSPIDISTFSPLPTLPSTMLMINQSFV